MAVLIFSFSNIKPSNFILIEPLKIVFCWFCWHFFKSSSLQYGC